jgi:hypothetical protein
VRRVISYILTSFDIFVKEYRARGASKKALDKVAGLMQNESCFE